MITKYTQYLYAKNLSTTTIQSYLKVLNRIDNVSEKDLEAWYYENTAVKSASYRCFVYSTLNGYGNWLVLQGVCSVNPMSKVPRPRSPQGTPKPLSDIRDIEIKQSIQTIPLKWRAAISLTRALGLRASECLGLR